MLYFFIELHMENQINVIDRNIQQVRQNPISQPAQLSEKPKFNYWMISTLILTVLLLGVLGWYIFSVSYQTGSSILPTQPPLPNNFACSQNSDCVVGIQAAVCCSCPKAINKDLVGTKGWEAYESGKDYSSQQTESCGGTVDCYPCELPETPVCFNRRCQFLSQTNIRPPDDQEQRIGVIIQLGKTIYKVGEPVAFVVTNKTQNNIYYIPETCASDLVQVFAIRGGDSTQIFGDPKVCMLAPSVVSLLPNKNISGKIPDDILPNMTPGKYKIVFEYSTEKIDRFAIGERLSIESAVFKIVSE